MSIYNERQTEKAIAISMTDRYNHMLNMLQHIPQGCNIDEDKMANYYAMNIIANEQEMILDPIVRQQKSMLRIVDEN